MANTSCKKELSEKPRRFDPAIQGVAVAPLSPIDPAMARAKEGAVPSHRNTASLEADGFILEPRPEPTITTPTPVVTQPSEPAETTEEFDFDDFSDPNS